MKTPIHPGEVLADELEALDLSSSELARRIKVPTNRVTQIIKGSRSITADTALRLGRFFGTSALFWMNLQKLYELDLAAESMSKDIDTITPFEHSPAPTA